MKPIGRRVQASEREAEWHMEGISHQCLLWETREWTWRSSFSERIWSWCPADICVMWAPLSALLAGFPLSWPGSSLGTACAVLFNLLFILCANDPFAAVMTVSPRAVGVLWKQARTACKTSLPSHFPFLWRLRDTSSAPSACLNASRGCYTKSGEIQSWMLIIFPVFPLRHSSVLAVPRWMLRASIPRLLQCCARAAREPRQAALRVQAQSSAHH